LVDQRIGTLHYDYRIIGIRDRNDRRAGMGLRRGGHVREIDTLSLEKSLHPAPEGIATQTADQRRSGSLFRRRDRLIGAFPARKEVHLAARDRLSNLGKSGRARHNVHVDAAGNEYGAHVISSI
jgi:hypothetical protein